jgi:general secretion pathway protein G
VKHARSRAIQAGFTLIEIMVVIVILAILASFVIQNTAGMTDEARITKAKSDISTLQNALEMYKLNNYDYPTTDQGLRALVEKPADTKNWRRYVKGKLPVDSWGNDYQYLSPGSHGEFDLYSLGKDKQPSEDDIGNWDLN